METFIILGITRYKFMETKVDHGVNSWSSMVNMVGCPVLVVLTVSGLKGALWFQFGFGQILLLIFKRNFFLFF